MASILAYLKKIETHADEFGFLDNKIIFLTQIKVNAKHR